jgi:hypothetical protein
MVRRSILGGIAGFVALVLVASSAGAAVRPFGQPQTVIGGCPAAGADSVTTPGGVTQGYASCLGVTQNIRFFSRNADGTVNPSQATGWVGDILGVTGDGTATYVLFADAGTIRIGKRTNAGAFSSRAVDTYGGVVPPSGDVIASGGQWFGVWSEQTGPGGEFAQTELYYASTSRPVRQLTATVASVDDGFPTLAATGSIPVLIWERTTFPAQPGPTDLMVAKFLDPSWETPRVFASAGEQNLDPDMAITGGRTFVTWERDGFIMVASNSGGAFTSKRFNTGGIRPRVAASATGNAVDHVFVTWTAMSALAPPHVFFAESATTGSVTGTWDGTAIEGPETLAFGVGAADTKAIVTYAAFDANVVAARAQT